MTLLVRSLLVVELLLGAACSSPNDGNSKVAALSTVSAVVVGGALAPVGKVFQSVSGSDRERRLSTPAIYDLGDGRVAIANRTGWFTDKSEFATPGQQGQSAWVVNLKTEPRDQYGAIVLANDNLVRWFFRDHDRATLRLILYEGPLKAVNTTTGDRIRQDSDHRAVTLLLGGASYRITLSQDPIETLQSPAR